MERQSDEDLPPIPEEVRLEINQKLNDGSLKWLGSDDPLWLKIPPAYFSLDEDFIDKLVRAGAKGLPASIKVIKEVEARMGKLKFAYQQLGKDLVEGRLNEETDDMMIQRIVRSVFEYVAHSINEEKTFVRLARDAYRQAHGTPRRGPRSLEEDCFWAIDSSLGPSGHGFPPFHWVQRASEKGDGRVSLPYPFNDTSRPHVRATMAELIRMIQAHVPEPKTGKKLPESTARKYARLWEKEVYPQKLTMSERWTLHKARNKAKKG